MTTVRLCLRVPETFTAVLNIYDVTRDGMHKENKPNLLLQSGDYLDVKLNAGKYIAELRLPGGNLIRTDVEVKDQALQSVDFYPDTPHEWLRLQALVGNVKREPRIYRGHNEKVGLLQRAHEEEVGLEPTTLKPVQFPQTWIVSSQSFFVGGYTLSNAYLSARFGIDRSEIKEGYFFLHPEVRKTTQYDREGNLIPHINGFSKSSQQLPINPTMTDNITQLFEIDKGQTETYLSRNDHQFKVFDYSANDFQRAYLWTRFPGFRFPHQYSVLPIPWKLSYGRDIGKETSVQIIVNIDPIGTPNSENLDAFHRISIAAKDEVMTSLLGYLGSGDLSSASLILGNTLDKAKDFLMFKMINPFAAAAGAYVMLEQSKLDQKCPWHDWIKNLMNWFKWLPDGAIQYAWLQLAETNAKASEADIRKSLLEAYNRGLPYYSAGVKLLLNGLTIFAQRAKTSGKRDMEIEKSLENVRMLASRTDRRQPFTSVIAD